MQILIGWTNSDNSILKRFGAHSEITWLLSDEFYLFSKSKLEVLTVLWH